MSTAKTEDRTTAIDADAIDELFASIGEKTTPAAKPSRDSVTPSTARPIRSTSVRAVHPRPRNHQPNAKADWVDWLLRFVAVGCFAFGVYLFLTVFSWSPLRDHPVAQPVRNVVTKPRVVIRNIEDFDVGMRASGRNPLREQVAEGLREPDPETSRKLVMRMTKESGRILRMKLLRSVEWINTIGASEGETIFVDLPEMGAIGDAFIEAILPSPEFEAGPGNLVTGVFEHEADPDTRILRVEFSNGAVIKGVTDNHPFWSVDHNDFVAIGDLKEGDSVKDANGVTEITRTESRAPRPGEMLYNLETFNEHVYQVTEFAILVHNNCWNDFQKATRGIFTSRRQAADAYRHINSGIGRIRRPTVSDSRFQNLVNDLYKGDRMPRVIGTCSTADAARLERIMGGGFRLHGRDHLNNKGPQYVNALRSWLRRNPGASSSDITAAQGMLDDLLNALAGH